MVLGLVVSGVWLGLVVLGLVVSGVWLGLCDVLEPDWLCPAELLLDCPVLDCPVEDPLGAVDWAITQAPQNKTTASKLIFPNFML